MTNEQEVLELATKMRIVPIPTAYCATQEERDALRRDTILEFAQAIRDQESAKVAMLVDALRAQRDLDYTLRNQVTGGQLERVWELQEKALSISAPEAEAFIREKQAEVMPKWQPIETAPSGVPVLIFYVNAYGKSRVIKARHIARFTEEATYYSCEEGVDEYDEDNDRYTYREGWWEMIDNWEDYGFVIVYEGTPTHWMPLPAAPKLRNAKEV